RDARHSSLARLGALRLSWRKSSLSALAACLAAASDLSLLVLLPPASGLTDGNSGVGIELLTLSEPPAAISAWPPGSTRPANAFLSECCSEISFDLFTELIENSTMNSAISSVIMSAYVSSQRSSLCASSWPPRRRWERRPAISEPRGDVAPETAPRRRRQARTQGG